MDDLPCEEINTAAHALFYFGDLLRPRHQFVALLALLWLRAQPHESDGEATIEVYANELAWLLPRSSARSRAFAALVRVGAVVQDGPTGARGYRRLRLQPAPSDFRV